MTGSADDHSAEAAAGAPRRRARIPGSKKYALAFLAVFVIGAAVGAATVAALDEGPGYGPHVDATYTGTVHSYRAASDGSGPVVCVNRDGDIDDQDCGHVLFADKPFPVKSGDVLEVTRLDLTDPDGKATVAFYLKPPA